MKITNIIPKSVMNKAYKVGFAISKRAPELLTGAGIVLGGAGVFLACKKTLTVNEIIEESKDQIDLIHKVSKNEEGIETYEKYTEEEKNKDLVLAYSQTAVKLIKHYAPAVLFLGGSAACFLASNNILRKRNIGLAAAYAAIDHEFKDYRNRVVEKFGDKVDKQLKYGLTAEKIEEVEVNEKTGKEKKVTKEIEVAEGIEGYSRYARFFDDASQYWTKDPEYNLMFLRAEQQYANDLLMAHGRLYLNEVYDMLDIPRTKAGQVVGWVYDEKNPKSDCYVDFGIYNVYRQANREFVNGYERSILLDFNVDGYILNR